ncbi:MAG TPA: ATP-binding protein [Mycobacteriales bacterium]|jgi:serine/threonine-protein kinase RsbW|nr:ATP-binding protein [Mycobacteriales bacterium]
MEIKLTLALPRDQISVPVVRQLLKQAMDVLGVLPDVTYDIELALTEACTNVLEHAAEGDEYEVSAGIDGDQCVIEVIDRGSGFDGSLHGLADAQPHAEDGRGIQLMRALVDRVTFTSRPHAGTVVHLEKQLLWQEGSAIQKLTQGRPRTEGPWTRDDTLASAPTSSAPRSSAPTPHPDPTRR